jgi:hypothetical protein
MTPDEPSADETPVRWHGVVNSPDGLNLRRSPDTLQPTLAVLNHLTPLQVLDDLGDWLHVIVDGQAGYVYAAHVLRRLDPVPLEPDTEGDREPDDVFAAPGDQQIRLGPGASSAERAVAGVWNRFGAALTAEAQRLQIDPLVAAALLAVESNGHGFGADGRLLIRFENHIFYHYWGQHHQSQFFAHFAFDSNAAWRGQRWRPDPNSAWQDCHVDDQAVEWQVFNFARQLDETAALLSISMGIAQIMGFNHDAVGFPTVQAMFQAYSSSIANQIGAFFRFLESKRLVEAVRNGDYHAFARGYNGSGQADQYAGKLHAYIAALRALLQPAAAPEMAGAPAPGALPGPAGGPGGEADEDRQYRLWWLQIGAAALCVLAVAGIALYRAGWRLVVRRRKRSTWLPRMRRRINWLRRALRFIVRLLAARLAARRVAHRARTALAQRRAEHSIQAEAAVYAADKHS